MHILIIVLIYLRGLFQGINFTTIPAAAHFLTSEKGFSFSATEYGALYIPMFLGAFFASFFGGFLSKRYGLKIISLFGNIFSALAMLLFFLSQFWIDNAFYIMLLSMLFLGSGFGCNLTTLNVYVVRLFPKRTSIALTALHAFLGIGTAIGPLLFNYFYQVGFWQIDPLLLAICFVLFALVSCFLLPNPAPIKEPSTASSKRKYSLLVTFLLIAFIYGYVETIFGNWGLLFLRDERGVTVSMASLALSVFWAFVTIGRVVIALLCACMMPHRIFILLAPIILLSLILLHFFHGPNFQIISFALAGIGCSAFLPFSVSYSENAYLSIAEIISGSMIAIYMLGYGIASFATGLFVEYLGASLAGIFNWLIVFVIALGCLTFWGCRQSLPDSKT